MDPSEGDIGDTNSISVKEDGGVGGTEEGVRKG